MVEKNVGLSKEVFGEESSAYCGDVVNYADELHRNGRECGREVELVDSILAKGSVKLGEYDGIRLAKLKKKMEGEDTIEEDKQWLELRKNVAQQEGKQSHHYMNKMCWEISVEERTWGGKQKELVEQSGELMQLAHQTHYHQHD